MTPSVTVIDYGLGNIRSVTNALRACGASVEVADRPDRVRDARRVILPGVGAFADGIAGLRARHLAEAVKEFANTGRPLLGICLGMQLLMGESEEFGKHVGLALIPGRVVAMQGVVQSKVPHVGWNRITNSFGGDWSRTLLRDLKHGTMMYFVHSFCVVPESDDYRLAEVSYGGARVAAAVQKHNIVGFQFHPERSGPDGLLLLQRFLET